ncbi:MAG: Ig-like domain-containing protein, partial [Myxococcales bacterium]
MNSSTSSRTPYRLSWLPLVTLSLAFFVGACGSTTEHRSLSDEQVAIARQPLSCGAGGSGGESTVDDKAPGALIVDLGSSPQTQGNALNPYGLVYDLVKNLKVPVLWAYNTSKTSNTDVDFTVDGRAFRSSSFVIPSAFVATAQATVNRWVAQGVVVYGPTQSAFTPPTYFKRITGFPNIVLDPQNGAIAQTYLTAAGFPTFPVQYPTSLNVCQDMFILPHADPTWANHGNLKSFVSNGGFLWVGCHAVSILEELDGDGDSAPDMNFLSSIGLINYANHVNAYPPYNYDSTSVADPVMQFLGKVDSAVSGGSEAVYLPYRGGAWRPTTKVSIWDPDQADVTTGKSPGLAAKLAYGRGYGLASSGVVMYQGSHNFSGTSADQIASQRAFLNLVLWNASEKSVVVRASVPTRMFGSTGVSLTSTASSSGTIASYQWTSSCGGTFGTPTEANTTFMSPPAAIQNTPCVIRLTVADSCGRVAFDARDTTILGLPDLAVTVTPSSLTPSVGSNLDYTITANNVGGLSTVNSNVTFTLPPASQYTVTSVTTSPAGIACASRAAPNTNVYDCALGDLDGCNPVSIVVHGTVTGAGCFGVDVTGTTTSNDVDLGSNTASAQGCVTTTGNNPVLIKRVSPAAPTTVNPGGTLSYTLTLLNAGGTKLDNIHIYDPYPATTTTYVAGSTSVTYRSYTATIADSFAGNSYNGSTGQQPWAGPWTEINDGNGRPNRGRIRVRTNNCASTSCPNMTAAVEGLGLQRPLSLVGATGATLSFSYRVPTAKSGQTALVQVSGDGGTTWRTLDTISLGTQVNTSTPASYPLQPSELTGNARLRFTTTGTASAVFVPDDVSLLLQIAGTTRTASGSVPIAGNSWDLTQNLDGQLSLKPGESMTVTFRATVNSGVAGGTLISNTANVKTTQTNATAFNSNTVSVSTAASATSAPVAATQTVALLEDVLGGNLGITAPTDVDTAQANLTVTVKRLPRSSQAVIYLADGVTPVSINQSLTAAQLTSLRVNGAPDFNGTADEFNYVVTDPQGNSSTGVATITLTAVNDAPVAYPDQASTQKGVSLVLDPPGTNDTDVDGFIDDALCDLDPLTAGLQSVFINAAGTWTVDTDTGSANFGSVTFVPAASFTGTAAISYSIGDDGTPLPSASSVAGSNCSTAPTGGCITVRVNAPPVAVTDTFTVSSIGGDLDVAANDSDPDGLIDVSAVDLDPSTAGIQSTYLVTGKGAFTSLLNGRVHFAPIGGVFGGVSINYTIDDFDGGTSNSVALSVTVNGCSGAADCNDGNDCTSDACNAGVCVNANLSTTASCNDRNPGTKDDRCDGAGVCAGTVYACAPGPCESASVPNGSGCIGTPKVDGTACDDGSACTQTDSCQTGVCTGSNPVVCGGGDDCHDPGSCSPATGLCSVPAAKANGTSCNDGDACTQTDTCQGGACTGSNPITCTAIDQCHDAGTCSPATGTCSTPNKTDGAGCNDGNACTQTDTCQSGACLG